MSHHATYPVGYLLFAGESYYPYGGWGDLVALYETLDEALAKARAMASNSDAHYEDPAGPVDPEAKHIDWWQIVSVLSDPRFVTPHVALALEAHDGKYNADTKLHEWVEQGGTSAKENAL